MNASTGVQVGDHNTQINTAVDAGTIPAARDVAAAGVDNLPARSAVFVGRDLSEVDGLLNGAGAGVVVGQAAVHGLGGVGKTELALHYAREYRDRYDLIWWITADTADNVGLGLAALTRRLHPVAVLADAQAWAVSWLQTHTGWLLLLDNVEDITHITPLLGQVEGHGQVLVTTRRDLGTARWLRHGLTPLRLDVLSRPASVQLLTRLTGSTDTDGAEKLAAELGDLPLALEQAAAYISQHARLDFSGYRLLLAEQFTRVAGDAGEGTAQRGITGIWQLTMTAITDRSPLAGRVLAVLAWLAPDTLPEDVLLPLSEDPLDVDEALALLASYNMITRAGVGVSVHRLVQAVTRDLSSGGGPDAADEAAGLLAQAIPDSPIDNVAGWPRWNALLPHVDALIANLGAGHDNTYILYVGERAATYRQEQGQLVPAITLFEQMLTDYRRMFGDDHALTLIIQHNLAAAYQSAGRLDDAITLYDRVLRVESRRVAGANHPHGTLDTWHNLALAFKKAGRLAEAISLLGHVLIGYQWMLGPDHPSTLITRHNLARAYEAAGEPEEAIVRFRQILADQRRVLGDSHPNTLSTCHSLAGAHDSAGRSREAIALFLQVLIDQRRVLGPEHPNTLATRYNLAGAYESAGRLDDAITMYEQVLAVQRRVLGDDHPDTLDTAAALREVRGP